MAKVLILCPTYDHVDTLLVSIASVRVQRFSEWEMAVIGDGAPDRTFEILDAIRAEDPRIKAYRHPKSVNYGELYRDPIIRDSDAEYICQLSDDDLWAPSHLDHMIGLLEQAEWGNQAPLRVDPAGGSEWWPINHGTAAIRKSITSKIPVSAGPNYVSYRRDAYLRLPEGWTCVSKELGPSNAYPSDAYMWSKFFQNKDLSVASSAATTAVKFPSHVGARDHWTPVRRVAEIIPWLSRLADPATVVRMRQSGSVLRRMVVLLALHDAGRAETLDAALGMAGFSPADPDTVPRPAMNGLPMILPLTARQRHECYCAWLLVRAHSAPTSDRQQARDQLGREYSDKPDEWASLIDLLAGILGVDVGISAFAQFQQRHPAMPLGYIKPAWLLVNAGKYDQLQPYLDALKQRWPRHAELAALERTRDAMLRTP